MSSAILTADSKVLIGGASGMTGSAIAQQLRSTQCSLLTPTHAELDWTDGSTLHDYFSKHQPDWIVISAAMVGGIQANIDRPAEFLVHNLSIGLEAIRAAHRCGIEHILYLGSACIYPRLAAQPIVEEELMNGKLEPTNDGYSFAKLAGIALCDCYNRQYGTDYRALMPTNIYGPGDNFTPGHSHVLAGLMHRFYHTLQAGESTFTAWGDGSPIREFLHVQDLATACVLAMQTSREKWNEVSENAEIKVLNVGSGRATKIADLVDMTAKIVGYDGEINYDKTKPNGMPVRALDSSRFLSLGWNPKIDLESGIATTWDWFQKHMRQGTARV